MLVRFRFSSKHRHLACAVFGGVLVCCIFITFVDNWASPSFRKAKPRPASVLGNGGALSNEGAKLQNNRPIFFHWTNEQWEELYQKRVERIREVCDKDEIAAMRKVWRVAANRRWGKDTFCKSHMCPIIVNEEKVLFFCTIPLVASTKVKELFLNISNVRTNQTVRENSTALHEIANMALHRVSPMFYPSSTARRFFKMIFVRHPFDRLTSAFRSKAEAPRQQIASFYDTYWTKVMTTLRGKENVDNTSRITFAEFVWYLRNTLVSDYDEHWTPYSSRCDPCLVEYDFVGKLETAYHDLPYAFGKVDVRNTFKWVNNTYANARSLSLRYFSQLKEKDILDLYKIYRTDFLLFAYTLDDFLPSKSSRSTKKR